MGRLLNTMNQLPTRLTGIDHARNIGFVYLMRNNRHKFVKIGFSKQPKFREKTLQSEEPEIEIIRSHRGTIRDEKQLHLDYAKHRVRGEWFDLSDIQINTISALLKCFGPLDG